MLSYIISYTISRIRLSLHFLTLLSQYEFGIYRQYSLTIPSQGLVLSPHFHTHQTKTDLLSQYEFSQMLDRFTGSIAIDEMSCLTYKRFDVVNTYVDSIHSCPPSLYLVQVQGLYHNYNHSSSVLYLRLWADVVQVSITLQWGYSHCRLISW